MDRYNWERFSFWREENLEYTGRDDPQDGKVCFHCKCEKCGRLIHLKCEELSGIAGHLYSEHHFSLDPKRTVFYGICEKCI